jgi:hypothetical protein
VTWTRLDDNFMEHPKIVRLSDHAFRVYVGMLVYCNRFLTDGELSASSARAKVGRSAALTEIVNAGLAVCSDGSDGHEAGTVVLHDFGEYQQDSSTIRARRKADRERKARWRERRSHAVTDAVTPDGGHAVTPRSPTRPDPISVGTESSSGSRTPNSSIAPRKHDAVWDGFAEWLDRQPETSSERGAWNKAAKELRDIGVSDAAEIVNRGRAYERKYNVVPSPNGLVKHWSELNGSAGRTPERPLSTQEYLEREGFDVG